MRSSAQKAYETGSAREKSTDVGASAETILHLASFDRWTGAAAPAFSEVEALRRHGVESHYGYVGGGGLERRIGTLPFTHPVLGREPDPVRVVREVRRVRDLIERTRATVVHAHLTHDHWMARLAVRELDHVLLVRTFHSRRTIRRDPVTRFLLARSAGICVNNATFMGAAALAGWPVTFTPPPVDETVFVRGPGVRDRYGIPDGAPLLGFIGKVARDRGFEDAIRILTLVRSIHPQARLLIIGKGPHRAALEELSRSLGVASAVIWAGYHEEDLVEHLRTPDLMLFTASGSDEGHRAIVEAMCCGTPVVSYPLFGVRELMGSLGDRLLAQRSAPEAAAAVCNALLSGRELIDPADCERVTEPSRYPAAAARLAGFYAALRATR
jgi:glycosyltransferase involved in cell wall biosynthesis